MATITARESEQIERANERGATPVVFIHGLWLLPSSWDRWATVFEEAGYAALTPGWPDDPETVEEANAHPEVFADKTVGDVADHFADVIGRLVRKPAVIGHSFGGLLTQIIAGRGLAAASVAIDPAPFRGVLPLPISALKSSAPVLGNPANRNRAVPLTYDQFRFAFANAVDEQEARQLYETFAVPAPGAPLFQAATANLNPWTEAKVDSRNSERGPLLIISGERDNTIPWALANAAFKKQKRNHGRDRDHRDHGPRARAHDRQRLARGRRHGARVRRALRLGPRGARTDAADERPRRGDHERAVVDRGEAEAAVAIRAVVAEVARHERAAEMRTEHDHAPLVDEQVVRRQCRAADTRARLLGQVGAERGHEAGAAGERLVAANGRGSEVRGALEGRHQHGALTDTQRLVLEVHAHRQQQPLGRDRDLALRG